MSPRWRISTLAPAIAFATPVPVFVRAAPVAAPKAIEAVTPEATRRLVGSVLIVEDNMIIATGDGFRAPSDLAAVPVVKKPYGTVDPLRAFPS